MKANGAPEKIYVDSNAIGDDISTTVRTERQDYPTCTEYIRADVFIEKAYEYLSFHLDTSKIDVNYKFDFIEEFRKYMED